MTTDSDSGGRERFEPVIVDDDVGDVAAVEVGGYEGVEGIEVKVAVVPRIVATPGAVVDFGLFWVNVTLADAFPFVTTCRRTVFFLKAGTDDPPAAKKSKISLPWFPLPSSFLLLPSLPSTLLLFSEGDDAVVIAAFVVEAGAQGRVTIAFTGVLLVVAVNLGDDDDVDEDEPAL
jgi:hypothetical protein